MAREKLIILPKLCDCGADLKKQWFIYYSVRNPRTGKMERKREYAGLSAYPDERSRRQAAEIFMQERAQRLRQGWTPFADDETVIFNDSIEYSNIARIYGRRRSQNRGLRYWCSRWIEAINGQLDPSGTLPTYTSKLRIFSNWIDSRATGNDVTSIDNATVVAFFRWLIDEQKRSAKTVHDYRYILAGLFEWLVRQKVFLLNPVHDIPRCTRVCDHSPSPIHELDIAIFKEEIQKDPQLWLAVEFQYYCALRPGRELRLLRIQDIDFGRGQVTVRRSQAKTKVTRTVIIPRQFLQELRTTHNLMNYPRDFYVFGTGGQPGNMHLGKNNLRFRFNEIRKRLNMPTDYKFYSWKHTGGVQASHSGIPTNHIQMQMGHSSITTTEQYLRKMTGSDSRFLKEQFPTL